MADIRENVICERAVVDVIDDALGNMTLDLTKVTDDNMTELIGKVKTGDLLVTGQLVKVVYKDDVNELGNLHAIVIKTTRQSEFNFNYDLLLLTGLVSKENKMVVKINNTDLVDTISTSVDASIITAIKTHKLGKKTIRELLISLNIKSILTYNSTKEKFDTFF